VANGNGARRADLANKLEAALSSAITATLFAGDEPEQTTLLRDAHAVLRDDPGAAAAAARLEALGWTTPRLRRAPTNTLLSDIPGTSADPRVGGWLPQWITERINRRQRAARAMVDALAEPLDPGGRPWVVPLSPPVAAGTQSAEKTEFPTRTFTQAGNYQSAVPIGRMGDMSWQAAKDAQDVIMALVAEDVLVGTAAYLRDQLVGTAGTAATSVLAGLAAIEAGGWNPDTILLPLSRVDRLGALATLPPAATSGLEIVAGAPVGDRVIIASRAGLDIRVSDQLEALVTEPRVGGVEFHVLAWALYNAAANSVKMVTA
jgi:hypothetical protein